ncbi:uncharacterized protein [Amphiura filiformis]|uniref:uncharacterized protein n=1 Tax=Amphiura filiformis TaxID=82378 RepID=UPI003B2141F4
MVSSMRAHYLLPPSPGFDFRRATRFGCNTGKRYAAVGIVPTSPDLDPERLLPACDKQTTLMTTSHPFQFVPRRRRLAPPVADESYIIAENSLTPKTAEVGKSRPLDRIRARRRRVPTAPQTTLQVAGFDGGAPPDPTRTITGRKKRIIPDMTKLYSGSLPGWMTAF